MRILVKGWGWDPDACDRFFDIITAYYWEDDVDTYWIIEYMSLYAVQRSTFIVFGY